ncbi:MAG: hypothetical protein ACPGWR_33875, partial [Ardenticatenaceae bacterium]
SASKSPQPNMTLSKSAATSLTTCSVASPLQAPPTTSHNKPPTYFKPAPNESNSAPPTDSPPKKGCASSENKSCQLYGEELRIADCGLRNEE